MKLLSVGCISPQGSNLETISKNTQEKATPKTRVLEFPVLGKKRRIEVEQTHDSTAKLELPDSVLRRMSRSTHLVLSCIEEAKERSGLNWTELKSSRMGIIVGTTNGAAQTNLDYIQRLLRFDYAGASPNLFAQSVPNNIASSIAMANKWMGPTTTFVHRKQLLESLLEVASSWNESKEADFIWILLGNEVSLQGSYSVLFEAASEAPEIEDFSPEGELKPTESYSCFLLSTRKEDEGTGAPFSIEKSHEILSKEAEVSGFKAKRPEDVGPVLARFYYEQCFKGFGPQ